MSVDRWNSVLVLGGIRSGKSAFAESLVSEAPSVRYVATAAGREDDPEWINRIEDHQRRRPQAWTTEETGADPARLALLLGEAKPDDTLLIDDLGGWVTALLDPANQPQDDVAMVDTLAAAVRDCAGRVVLVSPEVGLSLVPATPVGRAFADALGTANQALAAACDRVALVVAGQATWLKPGDGAAATVIPVPVTPAVPEPPPEPVPLTPAAPAPAPIAFADPQVITPHPAEEPAVREPAARPAEEGPAEEPAVRAPAARPAEEGPAEQPAVRAPAAEKPADAAAPAGLEIRPGMDLPLPDPDAGPDAVDRLATLDLPGLGLGSLREVVEFAAATQDTTRPQPWSAPRVLLICGSHAGGASAGADPADIERRVAQVEAGAGALARLAGAAGADVAVVRAPASDAMEGGPALDADAVDAGLRHGWRLADAAGADGRDVLILAAAGAGTDAVAAAVVAATTGAEPVAVLPRVLRPGGYFDDNAWMVRCAAVRDALHRIRHEPRGAQDILAQLGGADLAVATGALLGAAARRIPVLLDGPVGIAAALVARDLASQSRHWCLLPDAGTLALVRQGADVLGLTPVVELGLDLGEGAGALAALPLLRTAITLSSALPVHPALLADQNDTDTDEAVETSATGTDAPAHDDGDMDFAEPEPGGPGPATTARG